MILWDANGQRQLPGECCFSINHSEKKIKELLQTNFFSVLLFALLSFSFWFFILASSQKKNSPRDRGREREREKGDWMGGRDKKRSHRTITN